MRFEMWSPTKWYTSEETTPGKPTAINLFCWEFCDVSQLDLENEFHNMNPDVLELGQRSYKL